MVEITAITAVGGPSAAPAADPQMRDVTDAEAMRFEQLVEIDAKDAAEQADVQTGLLQPEPVIEGAEPKVQPRTIGDALVYGIMQVKNDYDGSFARITETLAANKGKEISMQQALQIQYELMQVGPSQELTAKLADKTSSGLQTLFRNQG